MRLQGKVAIITGGAHGMGEAEARLFAKEGAQVVAADILAADAEKVAADIRAGGGAAIAAAIDVTREADWQALIDQTLAAHGRLDILVNNAGISGSSVGDPDGLDGWDRIIAVNQTSVFLGTKLAAEQMARNGGGSIVNISSIMGFVGGASGHPAYCASKGAVEETFAVWKTGIAELGKCQNVVVKLGGLGMLFGMFDFHTRETPPSSEELARAYRPYIETCIAAFGPDRGMFESNFPPDGVSSSYAVLWNALKRLAAGYSADEKAKLFSGTAKRVYRLA